MATWPTTDDALQQIGNVKAEAEPDVAQCLAAAIEYLIYRCEEFEVDDEDAAIVPESVRRACLLLTARLFRRRSSPEGVAEFGDLGPIRVQRVDPDIEAMLLPSRSWGIA